MRTTPLKEVKQATKLGRIRQLCGIKDKYIKGILIRTK